MHLTDARLASQTSGGSTHTKVERWARVEEESPLVGHAKSGTAKTLELAKSLCCQQKWLPAFDMPLAASLSLSPLASMTMREGANLHKPHGKWEGQFMWGQWKWR